MIYLWNLKKSLMNMAHRSSQFGKLIIQVLKRRTKGRILRLWTQKGPKSWLVWQFNLSNLYIWDSKYSHLHQRSSCRIWNWNWVQSSLATSTSLMATTSTRALWHFNRKSTNSCQVFKACLRTRSWQHALIFQTPWKYCQWGQATQGLRRES